MTRIPWLFGGLALVLACCACTGPAISPPAGVDGGGGNTPPTAAELAIVPEWPDEGDELLAEVVAVPWDADSDPISFDWTWYRDDVEQPGWSGPVVNAGVTTGDEVWRVVVRPFDGQLHGPASSAQVVIRTGISDDDDDDDDDDDSVLGQWRQIGGGWKRTCPLHEDGSLFCWGKCVNGECDVPPGSYAQVGLGGYHHNCAVTTAGDVVCWGLDTGPDNTMPPPGSYEMVADGQHTSCGLRTDGTAVCWGRETYGTLDVPPGEFQTITTTAFAGCGIRLDGTLECWGCSDPMLDFGECDPPPGTYVDVDGGETFACAIATDGHLECWGAQDAGALIAPAGEFVQVIAGQHFACAVRTDGEVLCWCSLWGCGFGENLAPTGEFLQLGHGNFHTCGERPDGSLECWGWNDYGQCDVPELP